MAIIVRCNECLRQFKMPVESSGKQARCPFCGEVTPVPNAGRVQRVWNSICDLCGWAGYMLDQAVMFVPRMIARRWDHWTGPCDEDSTISEPGSTEEPHPNGC